MTKVKKTYRLEQETVDELARLCIEKEMTATDVIEDAIRSYSMEPDACHTQEDSAGSDSGGVSAAVAALAEQLAVKDGQIAALNRALEAAQETAKAAQVLQGRQQRALDDAGRKRVPWWKRLADSD